MSTLSLTKEARIYDREEIASSISGAGKTGQLHVKECKRTRKRTSTRKRTLPNTIHKGKLKMD